MLAAAACTTRARKKVGIKRGVNDKDDGASRSGGPAGRLGSGALLSSLCTLFPGVGGWGFKQHVSNIECCLAISYLPVLRSLT